MRRKRVLSIMLAVVMAVGLTACKTPDSDVSGKKTGFQGTRNKDMVTLNIVSEPMELNPMLVSDSVGQGVLAQCMAGFTRLDEKDKGVADLAERWDISEDNTVYTMYLRRDAKWSNGDPVTAKDFYYSWVTQMRPETGTIYASYLYANIKNGEAFYNGEAEESELGLELIDDYTMTITWSHPMPEENGLFYLSQPFYLPVNQKAYEAVGAQNYAKDADKMVTNGAYKITEWVHDDHITLEKSADYYDAESIRIPSMKLVMIEDANTSLNAFMAGEIDLCNLYSEQIGQVKKKSEDAVRSYVDGGTWYINFNNQDENLSNVNLRKALAYSVDTQSLLDHVINDGSIAADGLVPNAIAGAGEESYAKARGSLFAYDKAAAAGYLDKALQELGKTKEELKLVFSATDSSYNQNQAAYLQQQWKTNLELDVELKSMSANALLEAQYNGDFSFVVDGWGPSENDAITFLENYISDHLNNMEQYRNPEYDKLIAASRQESDAVKRQELLIQAEKILMEDMVIGPLYFTCTTYAVSEKLDEIVRTPFQLFNVRDVNIAEK